MDGYGSQAGAGGQVSESQVMAAVSGRVLSSRADVGHATPQTFALPRRSAPHTLSVEHTGLSGRPAGSLRSWWAMGMEAGAPPPGGSGGGGRAARQAAFNFVLSWAPSNPAGSAGDAGGIPAGVLPGEPPVHMRVAGRPFLAHLSRNVCHSACRLSSPHPSPSPHPTPLQTVRDKCFDKCITKPSNNIQHELPTIGGRCTESRGIST